MEEPEIKNLGEMWHGFTMLSSIIGVLAQQDELMQIMSIEYQNKNSFQEHQCCAVLRIFPNDHSRCDDLLLDLMWHKADSSITTELEDTEHDRGYDLLTKQSCFISKNKGPNGHLFLTVESGSRIYREEKISDYEEGSIMGMMANIKQLADDIKAGE